MVLQPSLGRVAQIARSVRDISEATAFYRDTLGLKLLYSFEGMAFFDLDGVRLYLQHNAEAGPESILYFQVDDIVAAHDALVARGVGFAHAPRLIHRHDDGREEWLAFFFDPEGRPLALIAQRQGPNGAA